MLRIIPRFAIALFATTSIVSAADLPRRSGAIAPAPYYAPVPVFSWTGFYAGVTAGAAFRSAPASSVGFVGLPSPAAYQGSVSGSSASFTGGAHAGYNWQFQNNFVLGIEGDIDYVGRRSARAGVVPPAATTPYFAYSPVSGGSSWIATIRPRFGFALDRALLYVTGGAAFGSVPGGGSVTYVSTTPTTYIYGANATSETRVGWALGAGGEYAITPNLIGRVEYIYTSFGSKSVSYLPPASPAGAPGGSSFSTSYSNNVGLLRAGLSYKF